MKKTLLVLFLVFALVGLVYAVDIQFWHAMGGERIEYFENVAKEFEALHPDINVNVQFNGSYRDNLNKTIAAVNSGTPPNVVQVFEIGTQMMIDGGIIVPVQDLMDNDPTFDPGIFLTPITNYYTVGGKLYSIPFNSSTAIMYYNKTMFEEAGLDPDSPPRTFDDFIEVCKALTVKDANGNIEQTGFTWPLHSWFIEQLLAAQNAPLVNNGNGRDGRPTECVLNNPAGLTIFEWLNTLAEGGYLINTKFEDWSAARNLFMSQKAGILFDSTSNVASHKANAAENGYELGTCFLPKPADAPSGGAVIGGASLWIIDGNPMNEMEASWEFVKFLNSKEQQMNWHKFTGYFPVTKEAVEGLLFSGFYQEEPDHMTAMMQLLLSVPSENTAGAICGVFPEMRTIIETKIQEMCNGEITPVKAIDEAAAECTAAIEEYNSIF